MKLGTLRTIVLQDHSAETVSVGYFEQSVEVNTQKFHTSGMKFELFKHTIAQYLANAILTREVPAEYWEFEPEREVAKQFLLPAIMPMKRASR